MNGNAWHRRVERLQELATRHPFAAEVLRFYAAIARFQEEFYSEIGGSVVVRGIAAGENAFDRELEREVAKSFLSFVAVVETNGPGALRELAREFRGLSRDEHFELLRVFWNGIKGESDVTGPADFFARAFLQPYAVMIRERGKLRYNGPTAFACPFCKRKPGLGVLRPLGDGGQRSLMCSFCLAEWEFRRILCPGCGEGDPAKLPVYVAEESQHVRVEGCDSCKSYIKTVDLTKSGLADPLVDEMASIPLDLWAKEHGYTKLQQNLMQF